MSRAQKAAKRPSAKKSAKTASPKKTASVAKTASPKKTASVAKTASPKKTASVAKTASPKKAATGAFEGFPPATFEFLSGIAQHNDKAWYDAHRAGYDAGYVAPGLAFVAALGPRLASIVPEVSYEPRINGSLFRIQRDTRFSNDKSPYKTHLDLWFWTGDRRGWDSPGFYFRMFPDRLMLGAGMHRFEKPALERFRLAVLDAKAGRALDDAASRVRAAGAYDIGGATRKTVPRGLPADHARAAWLLHEGLHAGLEVPLPREARSAHFVDWCEAHFRATAPIVRWLRAHLGAAT